MSILHVLKEDLEKEGKTIEIDEYTLEISDTDIMMLNNEIEGTVKDREIMLKQSGINASRFPITK